MKKEEKKIVLVGYAVGVRSIDKEKYLIRTCRDGEEKHITQIKSSPITECCPLAVGALQYITAQVLTRQSASRRFQRRPCFWRAIVYQ